MEKISRQTEKRLYVAYNGLQAYNTKAYRIEMNLFGMLFFYDFYNIWSSSDGRY